MFKLLLYYLFSQLGVGGIVALLPVDRAAGWSFFRFCGIASAACLGLALAVSLGTPRTAAFWLLLAAAVVTLAYVVAVVRDLEGLQTPLLRAAALAGLTGIALDGWLRTAEPMPAWASPLTAAYFVVSALFLGSVIFGMILGHWYLVVPTLPIDPLRRLTHLMTASTIVKALLVIVTLWLLGTADASPVRGTVRDLAGMRGLFFWARALFGLIGPLAICYMTWQTVKLNATQAATGLLYAATIFALIGETLSRFVFYTTDLPV